MKISSERLMRKISRAQRGQLSAQRAEINSFWKNKYANVFNRRQRGRRCRTANQIPDIYHKGFNLIDAWRTNQGNNPVFTAIVW